MNNNNPFTENISTKYFVGREHQIAQFSNDLSGLALKNPNHQYIAGREGSGKSTYLSRLGEICRDRGFVFASPTLDLEGLSRAHVLTIMTSAIAGVDEYLSSKGNQMNLLDDWHKGEHSVQFKLPRTSDLRSDYVRSDFEVLVKYLAEFDTPGVIIAIDEGQRIDGRAMSALKNALQHLNSFLVIISLRLVSDEGGVVEAGRIVLDTKATAEAEGDVGASRFYVTGIPIGAFDSIDEAQECVSLRLKDNCIQFDEDVIQHVASISARVPKNIVRLSNHVYNSAQQNGTARVDLAVFNEAFTRMHQTVYQQIQAVVNACSIGTKDVLRALVQLNVPSDAKMICDHLYPDARSGRNVLQQGIQIDIDRLLSTSTFCVRDGDKCSLDTPVHHYALKLIMSKS